MHGYLCKHLGIDSSTDHPDRYSNLFLNAYINRHVLLNLLNELGKSDKRLGLSTISLLFRNEFNKFSNTGA